LTGGDKSVRTIGWKEKGVHRSEAWGNKKNRTQKTPHNNTLRGERGRGRKPGLQARIFQEVVSVGTQKVRESEKNGEGGKKKKKHHGKMEKKT